MEKFLAAVCAGMMVTMAGAADACKLSFAWDPWAPYQMIEHGKLTGFDIEVFDGIAKKAGCEVTYREQSWTRSMEDLKNGTLDMVGGASLTEERKLLYNFSDAYRMEKMSLFIRKEDADNLPLNKISDIIAANMKISVVKDYSYGDEFDAIAEGPDGAKYVEYSADSEHNIDKVVNKRADGFIDDELVGVYLAKKAGVFDKLSISPVEISVGNVHFMFSKKVPAEHIARINQAIKDFENSQEYKQLVSKYTK